MNYEYFFEYYKGTCSINNLKPDCVTFIRKYEYVEKLRNITFPLAVIISNECKYNSFNHIPDNVRFFYSKNVDFDFTMIHNSFQKVENPELNKFQISKQTHIHPTVIYDVEGIKVAFDESGKKAQFIHTGGVEIKDNVEIGPYTVIHRASMDMTIINEGCKIGAHCNIGHNNIIGEDTVMAAGVMLSGSIKIGKNCWLGTGSSYRQGITICDNVVIGVGSVVVKDITKPGIYIGNPARFLRELKGDKGWDS